MRHHATELQRSWRHPKKTGRREQGNTNNIGKIGWCGRFGYLLDPRRLWSSTVNPLDELGSRPRVPGAQAPDRRLGTASKRRRGLHSHPHPCFRLVTFCRHPFCWGSFARSARNACWHRSLQQPTWDKSRPLQQQCLPLSLRL